MGPRFLNDPTRDMSANESGIFSSSRSEVSTTLTTTKLSGRENYLNWRFVTKLSLKKKGLWALVTDEAGEVREEVAKGDSRDEKLAWQKRNDEAQYIIVSGLAPDIVSIVMETVTASEAWDTLKQHYQCADKAEILRMKEELLSIKLESGESINSYLGKIRTKVYALKQLKSLVSDDDHITYILRGLPKQYDGFKKAVRYGGADLSISTLSSDLRLEELELKNSETEKEEKAFAVGPPTRYAHHKKDRKKARFQGKCRYCRWVRLLENSRKLRQHR
jgi:hypothetical protein